MGRVPIGEAIIVGMAYLDQIEEKTTGAEVDREGERKENVTFVVHRGQEPKEDQMIEGNG